MLPTTTKRGDCLPCAERARLRRAADALAAEATRPADLPRNAPTYLRPPTVSREADAHRARGGKPYSLGHQKMYTAPIEMLKGAGLPAVDVLDVGAGIGFGMRQLLRSGVVANYYGVEPDAEAFALLAWHMGTHQSLQGTAANEIELIADDFLVACADKPEALPAVDYVFCIEVIEHVAAADVPTFLQEIHKRTKRALFLSTPDAATSTHGVATVQEWKRVLKLAGFDVVTIQRHWTTLFICEPRG
jgi:2-polyprenyl-3-methyl-5-hydroxy-6-metoxy-1,4-benzoquinol methylase